MDRETVADIFSAFGTVDVRRMFGGFGIYADGVIFALCHDDAIYLKADDETKDAFEREGQGALTYIGRGGKEIALPYWRIPERLYDDADELAAWAKNALAVARRAPMKPKRTPRRVGRATGSRTGGRSDGKQRYR